MVARSTCERSEGTIERPMWTSERKKVSGHTVDSETHPACFCAFFRKVFAGRRKLKLCHHHLEYPHTTNIPLPSNLWFLCAVWLVIHTHD